ncbi:MAG: 3'-5' exonuclease [Acidobacteriota bacterium]
MAFTVIYTKPFNRCLRDLLSQGHKKIVQAVRAACTEAGMNGEIRSLPRTKHGETRISNVEKYDLSDGHRLVVQLVDGAAKIRAFLFCGSHDDTDRWLDSHRNYQWVKSRTDGTLEFVQVTEVTEERHVPADRIDLESPEDLLGLPLLRFLSPDERERLNLPLEAQHLAWTVSGSDYERDAEGILTRLDELAGAEKACLVFDLLWHAHAREWSELHRRISVASDDAIVVPPSEVAPSMLAIENSESFITFDDPDEFSHFFADHSMADWMLFLHPEQKKVAERDFRGPARLRGVSGSGKTSVLVHRARYLAKKYNEPILLVTLAGSMRKLLDHLTDDLCGVESSLIQTTTMSRLARQVVQELNPRYITWFSLISPERQERLVSEVVDRVRAHSDVARTPLHSMERGALLGFLRDEIPYVRGRLWSTEFDQYLDAQSFQRRGRGLPLNETARRVILAGIRFYEDQLAAEALFDHEGIVAEALKALDGPRRDFHKVRCVLCDEVQDLSQLEMALIASLPTTTGQAVATAENGLFLAGDGAQTIYKRGFTFRRLGIDVKGRSFSLRKNYRNTHEILKAAFGLVSEYEFADVDEDDIARPSAPELAKRHGSRPIIVRCSSLTEEASAIATRVLSLMAMGHKAGQICIVGANKRTRESVKEALSRLGVEHTDLHQDAYYESDRVKVSTIESAKGHEFGAVFIMGLVEGVLPKADLAEGEIPLEAARLYVAMTRARESLTITYSPSAGSPASRFLLAIQADCDEARFRNGQVVPLESS